MALKRVGVELIADKASVFERAIKDADSAVAKFGDGAGKAGRGAASFDDALKSSGRQLSTFEKIAGGALHKIGVLAVDAFASAGKAVVGFLGDSIGIAGDFQASMGRFESITGPLDQAGKSAEDFSKKFIKLGMDTQFSAQEASNAAAELAKGGVSVGEIMGGATEATLALASAGELGLAPAATIVAKQLGVWRDQGVGAADVSDLLSQAANASTVNVDDLSIGLANVGGVAKVAGLSFEETVQTMALISPGFSSASDAGTSFKAFLNNLQPTTKSATKAMMDLGLYTSETGSVFYDSKGEFVGMQKATELLHTATKDLTEEERSLKLETIFGSDAQRAAALIAQDGTKAYDAMGASMEGMGSATDQATRRNKGFNFALDQLKGSVETAQIVIGSKFLPIGEKLITNFLIPAVNSTMAVADALEAGLGAVASNIIPIISGLTGAAIAFFAPAMAASVATGAWGLTLVLAAGQAMTAALAFAAAAIPLAAIAISVGAIAFAFVDFNKNVTEGRDRTRELARGYQEATAALEAWRQASPAVQAQTKAQADEITKLKNELSGAIDRQSAWYSFIDSSTSEQRQVERIVAINTQLKEMAPAFQAAVVAAAAHEQQLADQTVLYNALESEAIGATGALVNFTQAETAELAVGKLSTEEKEAFNKQITEIREKGPGTYDGYLQSFVDYTAGVQASQTTHNETIKGLEEELAGATTDTQRKAISDKIEAANASFATQRKDAAIAYGEQQAAQLQHLGQMLIDYTIAQGTLHGVSQEAITEMTTLLANEYGVQQSLSDKTFGAQTADLDAWAASGGKNSEKVITDLAATSDQAIATQRKMNELTGEYTVELLTNLDEGKIDVDELADGIARIPARVNTEVQVDTHRAVSAAAAVQSRYDRLNQPIETPLKADPGNAISGANTTKKVYDGIPKTVTTTAKLDGAAARGAAHKLGGDLASGIAVGIAAAQTRVNNAVSTILNNSIAAGRRTVGARSPAVVPAELIGKPIGEGVAVGIASQKGKVGKAMGDLLTGSIKGGDAGLAMAKTIGEISEVIGKAVESLGKLNGFSAPTREALESFSFTVRDAVAAFAARGTEVEYALTATTDKFAETSSKAVGAIGAGVDSLSKLHDFEAPSRDALLSISYALRDVTADAWHRAQETAYALDGTATLFAETSSKAVGVIGSGVDNLAKLKGFTAPSREALLAFSYAVRDVVADTWHRAQEVAYALDGTATTYADAAGKAVSVIGAGVDAFTKLATYGGVPRQSLELFSVDLQSAVVLMAQIASAVDLEGVKAAAAFAESVGKVVAPIKTAVEAFGALQDYERVASQRMQALFTDIEIATGLMMQIAVKADAEGVQAAAAFSTSVKAVFEGLKAGVDALEATREYETVSSERMQALFTDIQQSTALMTQIAANADAEGVKAAAAFSASVKTVFDGLKGGVDALDAIRDYEQLPPERMAAMLSDFNTALDSVRGLASAAEVSIGEARRWQSALEAFAQAIKAGVDAIASIDGLTTSASIGVAVNASASMSAGAEAMASGGPARAGRPYLVGDGPGGKVGPWTEMFIPGQAGVIVNAADTRAMLSESAAIRPPASASQIQNTTELSGTERMRRAFAQASSIGGGSMIDAPAAGSGAFGGGGSTTSTSNQYNTITYNGVSSPPPPAQSFAAMAAIAG